MIPSELTAYPQWVLWREIVKSDGTRTKLPYSVTGNIASTTDPRTWSTYQKVLEIAPKFKMGIGFVLTDNDPFAFIDLDDPFKNNIPPEKAQQIIARHNKIVQQFDTYTEISPSGKGLHVIPKGAVPEGKRREQVEVYSSHRFMTMTGWTFNEKPIQDRGFLLCELWKELGGSNGNGSHNGAIIEEKEQKYSDKEIYEQAIKAENGEKFFQLWQGHWMDAGYKSQSEADFALINILSFFSRNVEQIKRMFFMSALGQRDKAKRKTYIDAMVKRSFDNSVPYVPLQELTTNLLEQLRADSIIKVETPNPFAGPLFQNATQTDDWTMPPGLMGDIAEFIYASAPRPVKQIALAASIGLMAGICGRSYNVSGTGLNQYVLMLAGTGTGKEAVPSGIAKLMRYVRLKVPAAMDFIGPSEIASGQALIRYLSKNPCFVSVVGEWGVTLQAMCAYNANSSQIMLRKKLLELYNKSGEKDLLQPTIYSDSAKTTETVRSPAFSLLCESNPESYYSGLDETMISQGLLPRFMAIEYLGPRPDLNKAHESVEPTMQLIERLSELASNCLMLMQNNRVLHIQLDAEAQKFADDFEHKTTMNINNSDIMVAKELWNRAHLKMLKLSALIALGIDPYNPIVTLQCVQWAHILVNRDVENIFSKFEAGKIGRSTNEAHQIQDMIEMIRDYLSRPYDAKLKTYLVDPQMHQDRVIPLAYLQRRLQQRMAYRDDRMGPTMAIKRAIDFLVNDGALQEVRQTDVRERYGKTLKAYAVLDFDKFKAS